MLITIIIAFAAFFLGFIVFGLMAEAKRNNEAEDGKNTEK